MEDRREGGTDFRKGRRQRENSVDLSKLDRLPPHSIEAEQGVLGCMLLAPQESINIVQEKKTLSDWFYDLRHQELFNLLCDMFEKGPIDLIIVSQELKDRKQLDAVGGVAYLSCLMDAVPSAANLPYYLDIVKEKAILRRLLHLCVQTVQEIYEFEGEIDPFLDTFEAKAMKLRQDQENREHQTPIKDLVHSAINTIEQYHSNPEGMIGLTSGFNDLDRMTTGFQPGEMVVIAARPSMGKTSLAMNVAEYVALDIKQPVGVFSLEMTAESLVLRMLCSRARVNLRKLKDGFLSEREFAPLTAAAGQIASSKIIIDDEGGQSIQTLRARARRMKQAHGIKLLVIDYLQLLNSTTINKNMDNRAREIGEITGGIKALAKELEIPVIVLAQLNRELERDNRKPRLSDLRESGNIEQDADFVGLLYSPYTDEDGGDQQNADAEAGFQRVILLIAKQRNGPTGEVPLQFEKGITRFRSESRVLHE